MRRNLHLDNIFSTPSAVKVLRVLAVTGTDMTGRQLAARANLSPQTTQNTLAHLDAAGLLIVGRAGRAKLYRFRPDNPSVKNLLVPLFAAERGLAEDSSSAGGGPPGEMDRP